MLNGTVELKNKHFKKVCNLVYQSSGINLKSGKEALVKTRLMKRLRALNIRNFDTYLKYVESKEGLDELGLMIDVMTTNKTSFFREPAHFDYLINAVLPKIKKTKIRIWSAACSSGEEPYSIAMLLRDNISDIDKKDIKILATDISKEMLEKANTAIYSKENLNGVPLPTVRNHFTKISVSPKKLFKVKEETRSMVSLAWLNLLGEWPMKGPFDVVFCRNVMIYFDRLTQQKLINRFWHLLKPGGYLFVGHSEGLSAVKHKFDYIQAAIYRK